MPEPQFIPQPWRVQRRAGEYPLDTDTTLWVAARATPQVRFAAQRLAEAITTATGLTPKLAVAPDSIPLFGLLLGPQDARPDPVTLSEAQAAELGTEGYVLDISPAGAAIAAPTETGLYWGVQTLIQALRTTGRRLPAMRVEDRPALATRGLMLDASRGRVPTLDYLKRLVDLLSSFKMNQFQLYLEHTFEFSRRREFGQQAGAYTAAEMQALDEYARARHVELVPNLQSYGHQRALLSLPEYEHLAETDWRWTLTPANEETYALLDEMYSEFLPNFSSTQFNVDCDESWDHGLGRSKALADERGKGRLYLDHILRLREMAAKHGRRIQVWADILLHYPELLPEIPDDVLLLDWRYENQATYPTVLEIARSGRPFLVCPGVSAWNTIFPRIDNALGNILGYTQAGMAAGAVGMLLTDWGDHGAYAMPAASFYPYAFGAETAWTGGQTSPDTFDAKAGSLLFGDLSGQVVAAVRRTGRAMAQWPLRGPNGSDAIAAVFDDPLAGRLADTSPGAITEMAAAAAQALAAFASLRDAQMRHELSFLAHMLAFAADKLALTRRLRGALADGAETETLVAALRTQRTQLAALRAEFESLWLGASKRAEIALSLSYYDTGLARHDAALAWLDAGNRDLATYTPDTTPVLWEVGRSEILGLAEIIGFENLPPEIRGWLRSMQGNRA